MTPSDRGHDGDDVEIVKWYTHARKFPQLIGKTADGATIWGGPYTFTQVTVGVVLLVVGSKTTWLWGHFGLVGNALILLGGTYGLILVIGRLPIGARNPLSVGAGALRALSVPAHGRSGGAPIRRPKRPHLVQTRLVITPDSPALRPGNRPPAGPVCVASARQEVPTPRSRRSSPSPPVNSRSTRPHAVPALTGVQLLLASTGTTTSSPAPRAARQEP
jgi:hypothetical protein